MRTYRYVGHSMSDAAHGTYRSKEEVEEYRQRDPIKLLQAHMRSAGMIDEAGAAALDREVVAEVEDAVTFAEESPEPAPEALWSDVLAGGR
jgi:pyruvate dehydrogenase E1 component alpha subunit